MATNNATNNATQTEVWDPVFDQTFSGSSSVSLTGLVNTYSCYMIFAENITFSVNGGSLRLSENTGGNWSNANNRQAVPTADATNTFLFLGETISNSLPVSSSIRVLGAAEGSYGLSVQFETCVPSSGTSYVNQNGGGFVITNTNSTSITIYPSSGTISGRIVAWGIKDFYVPLNPLYSWGDNVNGGTAQNTVSGTTNVPTQVGSATNWVRVVKGANCSIALRNDGTLWSWGSNSNGQTGLGTTTGNAIVPTQIGGSTDWAFVSASNSAGFAIKTNGTLWSWGNSQNGQTAQNTNTGIITSPTQVGSATNWSRVYGGALCGFAITTLGTLYSWGSGTSYQTGQNTTSDILIPTQVGVATDWLSIETNPAGNFYVFGLKTGNTLWSWGNNASGATAQNTTTGTTNVPTQVGVATDWASVSICSTFGFGLKIGNTLWSWGNNANGQTGQNTTSGTTNVPTQVGVATDWATVVAGSNVGFGIRNSGTMYSWGSNAFAKTAQNTTSGTLNVPTQVGVATNWSKIFLDRSGNAAAPGFSITTLGTLYSWGDNGSGVTGQNTTTGTTLVPTQVGSVSTWNTVFVNSGQLTIFATQSV